MSNVRVITLRIVFAKRPSAMEIHEWIDTVLTVTEDQIEAIQLDGHQNCLFLKLVSSGPCEAILRRTNSQSTLVTADQERINVTIEQAFDNLKLVRILNLTIEIDNQKIQAELVKYGRLVTLQDEIWNHKYKFQVKTGVRMAKMEIKKDIPSYVSSTPAQYSPRADYPPLRRHEQQGPVQTPVGDSSAEHAVNLNTLVTVPRQLHVEAAQNTVTAHAGLPPHTQDVSPLHIPLSSASWVESMDVESLNNATTRREHVTTADENMSVREKRPYECYTRATRVSPVRKAKVLSQSEQSQLQDRKESLELAKAVINQMGASSQERPFNPTN
ncbi:hypothetical protein PR048_000933 [Dryococelus australis]|uniref:Uncharacterized protein n=1 Tax=Dryococelus australis TaxID=614101 RepID=A0ABQ9IGJ7_9NEOP|nr:hypothetical protein PR048_000933 [Dryococelus australis]